MAKKSPKEVKAPKKGGCPNCGSRKLSISVSLINTGMAQDGRLKMNEIAPRFVIGCDNCSETIRIMTEEEVIILPLPRIARPGADATAKG